MKGYFANILILPLFILYSSSQPIPLNVNLLDNSTSNLDFALSLPNNDTVQIGLSFRLLTYNNPSNHNENESYTTKEGNGEHIPDTTSNTITNDNNTKNLVTVEEAIEGFRQDLIKKEVEIAGIIESKDIFYRHFRLEFDDETKLTIRCTYDSNYVIRSLKISCYEYHEFETERILSNGEVEIVKQVDSNYKSEVELLDLRGRKQTLQMAIS